MQKYVGATWFFPFNNLKADGPSISENLNFSSIPFQFNWKSTGPLVHWKSLHPKNAILPTFFVDKHHIFQVKLKTRITTYTIGELGMLRQFLAKGGGPTYTKKWYNNVVNVVAVKCTLCIARPLTFFLFLLYSYYNKKNIYI